MWSWPLQPTRTQLNAQPRICTALTQGIRVTFKDILLPGQEFFLQIKNKERGGAFFDLMNEEVADRSVIRAVLKPITEVSTLVKFVFFTSFILEYINTYHFLADPTNPATWHCGTSSDNSDNWKWQAGTAWTDSVWLCMSHWLVLELFKLECWFFLSLRFRNPKCWHWHKCVLSSDGTMMLTLPLPEVRGACMHMSCIEKHSNKVFWVCKLQHVCIWIVFHGLLVCVCLQDVYWPCSQASL